MRIPEPQNIIQIDKYSVIVELSISEKLVFFPGHFPQQSVLPGVVMVDWAIEFAERFLPIAVQFKTMEALKFRQIVMPPAVIKLHLQFNAKTQKLHFSYEGLEQQSYSSGKISHCSLLEAQYV